MNTSPRDEPRGLTLADLMAMVLGVAIAISLPDRAIPPSFIQTRTPAEAVSVWLDYLSEQIGKLGLAPGLAAILRCGRYRRPLRAPEFLALVIACGWAITTFVQSGDGWLSFFDLSYPAPRMTVRAPDPVVIRRWSAGWFVAGVLGGLGLIVRPIRRRLPPGVAPVFLLLAWFAATFHAQNMVAHPDWLAIWPSVPENFQPWFSPYAWAAGLLPIAAGLNGLRPQYRSRWPAIAWLAFALAFAAYACRIVHTFLGRFVVGNILLGSPEVRRWILLQDYALTPALVLLQILVLASLGRRERGRFARTASTTADHWP